MRATGWVLGLVACGAPVAETDDEVVSGVVEVGWEAELETHAHGVTGTAVLVDEATIELRDFHYDGSGVNARLFLITDGAPFSDEFELTDNLVGPPHDGDTLTLDVPADATPGTWDAITLWCIPFEADFGSGVFHPP